MNTYVKFKKLNEKAIMPTYGTDYAACADLCSAVDTISIKPGETVLIDTGLALEIPVGLVGLIFARSGIATKRGLAPANKVGVIDPDYRGPVKVALHNHGTEPQVIYPGDRIAQIGFVPYVVGKFIEVDELEDTARGIGGFGSTGTK